MAATKSMLLKWYKVTTGRMLVEFLFTDPASDPAHTLQKELVQRFPNTDRTTYNGVPLSRIEHAREAKRMFRITR